MKIDTYKKQLFVLKKTDDSIQNKGVGLLIKTTE